MTKLTKRVSGFDSSLEVPGAYRASLLEPRHPSDHIRRGNQPINRSLRIEAELLEILRSEACKIADTESCESARSTPTFSFRPTFATACIV